MDNKIEKYVHDKFGELDVMLSGDKFWFPARKCAEILGYTNHLKAIRDHCKGVNTAFIPSAGGTQKTKIIPEGDLYRLIIRSQLPSARKFEEWIFDNVLPSIRKHGAYIMPDLLEELQRNTAKNAELLQSLANEQRERIAAEERYRNLEFENKQLATVAKLMEETLESLKPKVSYYDTILQNPEAVPITLIAKDYGMPAIRFNILLHDLHIQYRVGGTWELYQEYANRGYTHGNVYYTQGGQIKIHTCWTQKGRLFLYEFLKKREIFPKIEVNT